MKPSDRERAKQIIVEEYDLAARVWDRDFVPATTPIRERLLELKVLTAEEAKDVPRLRFSNASGAKRLIEAAGFRDVRVITETFENLFPSAEPALDLMLYEVSAEYAAMPQDVQSTFRRELLEALRPLESPRGFGRADVAFALGKRGVD